MPIPQRAAWRGLHLLAAPIALLLALVAPCHKARAQAATGTIMVGYEDPISASLPLLIAHERGQFAAEGLDVAFINAGGTRQVVQQLIGNSIQIQTRELAQNRRFIQ